MTQNTTYTVYSMKMMKWLTVKGHKFVSSSPSPINSKLLVFNYEITPELMSDVSEYITQYRENKLNKENQI